MGTQAVVSIVRNKETIIKCVTGCNGRMALDLAKAIASSKPTSITDVHQLAKHVGYGCRDCLVLQDANNAIGLSQTEIRESLYGEKFSNPTFNPRWDLGIAAYIYTVDVDGWTITNENEEQTC